MIKVIAGAIMHPGSRTLAEFHAYWSGLHGPMFAKTPHLRRYVQHLTLPEAYGGDPAPTHDGASFFWYDDVETMLRTMPSPKLSEALRPEDGKLYDWYVASKRYGDPDEITLAQNVRADDAQLFDRLPGWPTAHKRTSVAAIEHVIVDGPTEPSMVKAVYAASKLPGLSLEEFHKHWLEVHGPLAARVPGLRRYVQNHVVPDLYFLRGGATHDGFAELWFDDLASLRASHASPEWRALREDGETLFGRPMSVVIAREGVIKG